MVFWFTSFPAELQSSVNMIWPWPYWLMVKEVPSLHKPGFNMAALRKPTSYIRDISKTIPTSSDFFHFWSRDCKASKHISECTNAHTKPQTLINGLQNKRVLFIIPTACLTCWGWQLLVPSVWQTDLAPVVLMFGVYGSSVSLLLHS